MALDADSTADELLASADLSMDDVDETEEVEGLSEPEEGREAQLMAAEEVMQAMRDNDAEGFLLAFQALRDLV